MSVRLLLIACVVPLASFFIAACGDDGDDGSKAVADTTCREVEAPPVKDVKLKAPEAKRPTAQGVRFETSCGSFTVTFDDRAPKTAASFQYLAGKGFFDDTVFHRVVPDFVIQGGDPKGASTTPGEAGSGGPGYSIDEKPPGNLSYTEGTVAMAKTGVEPPGRSGSQFFVVTAADAGLPPDYALLGKVTEGMDVVRAIAALGEPGGDGPPSMIVVVESATLVN